MKKIYLILFTTFITFALPDTSYSQNILDSTNNKANQGADTKINNAIDKGLDVAEGKSKPTEITEESELK